MNKQAIKDPKHLEGDVVFLNPENIAANGFHYGDVPNIHGLGGGIVIESDFSKPIGKITYLVEFGNKEYWFTEDELVK